MITQHRCLEDLARVMLPSGHELPGAQEVGVARELIRRAQSWHPAVRARVRWLVRAWEYSPLFSRHVRRFSRLSPEDQASWTESCYRSRWVFRRLLASALKQLIFLTWASIDEVEDALGYDYRCRRDDEPHGTGRDVAGEARPAESGPEPHDYYRRGPAIEGGAVPVHLTERRDFRPVPHGDIELQTRSWPELQDGMRVRADVVVVGSGAGGAVVAATLAEAGLDVLVLEEGRHVTARDFHGPMFHRFQSFCRDNGTTQVMGTPPIPLPLGKVVGGTTVVNSGTCFRAPARVLDRWRHEYGVEGSSAHEMAPYYEDVENFLNVRPVPWNVLGPNGTAAHLGAVKLGLSGGPLLRNIADCHGCGQCAFGCPTNAKQAMHISYLPRAQRAGARVYSRCRVERVLVDEGRAHGVEATVLSDADRGVGMLRVDADHVVVAAGAVHTPVLLDASGIPDVSRQTGRNLRIHPATGVGGFFGADISAWKGTLQSYYIDEYFDSHELMFEATASIPSIGAGSLPGIGERALRELNDMRRLATLGFYVSDTSRGRVHNWRGRPVPTYKLNALDARRMLEGLAIASEVLLAAGAARVYIGLPGLDAVSASEDVAQLRQRRIHPGHLRLTAFHPMGTARMGADADAAVVDSFGRHHNVAGLWVTDASVFPSCVGVNPQMTIMAFAKRSAEALVECAKTGSE